ncbi:MAG TPA: hypothetical protein ENK76_03865 [Campylobacterales bacterium]|nr:hypothetical protein [Campylobacterales bacterium]
MWVFLLSCHAEDTYSLAIDNRVEEVIKNFGEYRVEVYTNRVLAKEPSTSTKAVYGNINGKNTESLLKINSNYVDGDKFIVRVYENDLLVGESSVMVLSNSSLAFSDIITKKENTIEQKVLLMILANRSNQVNKDNIQKSGETSSTYIRIPTLLMIESLQKK